MTEPRDDIEDRIQAVMAVLRENDVTRTLPSTETGELVTVPFDDDALHGLAMQILYADAKARQHANCADLP